MPGQQQGIMGQPGNFIGFSQPQHSMGNPGGMGIMPGATMNYSYGMQGYQPVQGGMGVSQQANYGMPMQATTLGIRQ